MRHCDCPKVDCGCTKQQPITPFCDKSIINRNAYLWLHIAKECSEEFVPVDFCCFMEAIIDKINLSGFVTDAELTVAIEEVTALIPNLTGYATEDFVTAAIEGITFPDVSNFVTMEQVCDKLDAVLVDYYTKTQVDAIVLNLQNQLTSVTEQVNSLQQQLDECDCDGGGGGTSTTAPTLDSDLVPFTDPVCPQCQVRTITNPDNVEFAVGLTGDGTVTASVDGIVVSDLSSFSIPDGGELEICLTGGEGQNVVGGVSLSWIKDGVTQNIDGFNYDVTCPDAQVEAPNITCPPDIVITKGETISASATNAGGAVSNWSISPQPPNGVTFNNGTISVASNASPLTQTTYTVTAANASGQSTCTFNLTIEELPLNTQFCFTAGPRVVGGNSSQTNYGAGNQYPAGNFTNPTPPTVCGNSTVGLIDVDSDAGTGNFTFGITVSNAANITAISIAGVTLQTSTAAIQSNTGFSWQTNSGGFTQGQWNAINNAFRSGQEICATVTCA